MLESDFDVSGFRASAAMVSLSLSLSLLMTRGLEFSIWPWAEGAFSSHGDRRSCESEHYFRFQ